MRPFLSGVSLLAELVPNNEKSEILKTFIFKIVTTSLQPTKVKDHKNALVWKDYVARGKSFEHDYRLDVYRKFELLDNHRCYDHEFTRISSHLGTPKTHIDMITETIKKDKFCIRFRTGPPSWQKKAKKFVGTQAGCSSIAYVEPKYIDFNQFGLNNEDYEPIEIKKPDHFEYAHDLGDMIEGTPGGNSIAQADRLILGLWLIVCNFCEKRNSQKAIRDSQKAIRDSQERGALLSKLRKAFESRTRRKGYSSI
ncbi:MAG: hypothetical protein OXE99_09770 [Cellvibrionales bacterium]|nr:hypothetical protein [Cellvibrionales bacterium]